MTQPAKCGCGHYLYVHTHRGCPGWDRKWRWFTRLPRGFAIQVNRTCRCRITREED